MMSNYDLRNGAYLALTCQMHETGGTCTLHKNYKNAQLGHTAGEVEVQPLSPSLTLPLNLNPKTNVLCVLYCTRV